jgi:thiol-disulfide isomerase/thioredoxin
MFTQSPSRCRLASSLRPFYCRSHSLNLHNVAPRKTVVEQYLLDHIKVSSHCYLGLLLTVTNEPFQSPNLSTTVFMSDTTNFYEVKSSEQFQELLSADLKRISIINFWAPWAEPCRKMNELVQELAKKYQAALFLQVCNPMNVLILRLM